MRREAITSILLLLLINTGTQGIKNAKGNCPTMKPIASTMAKLDASTTIKWMKVGRSISLDGNSWNCISSAINVKKQLAYKASSKGAAAGTGRMWVVGDGNTAFSPESTGFLSGTPSNPHFQRSTNRRVLAADVNSFTYTIIYTCRNVLLGDYENVLILATTNSLTTASSAEIAAALVKAGLHPRSYKKH